MRTAATNITRVSLELGGKSANVVFDDADLDVCIEKSLWSVFDNAGQDCCARSRQFVQRGVYDEFVERFAARDRRDRGRRSARGGDRDGPADLRRGSGRRRSTTSRSASTRVPVT